MTIIAFFLAFSPILFALGYFISNGIKELSHRRRARRALAARRAAFSAFLSTSIGRAFNVELKAQFSNKPPMLLSWVDDLEQELADGAPAARRGP